MDTDEKNIHEILQQSPSEISYEDAKKAYYDASKNISQAIMDIWKLPPLPEKSKKIGVNADKWDEVRNICDEFDREATKTLHEILKNNRIKNKETDNTSSISVEEINKETST